MAPENERTAGYEVVEHTADWALRVYGRNLAQLLENAAIGMSHLMVGDLAAVPNTVERTLELEAFDAETLLVDWLSELAYWAEDEQLVFREFELSRVTENHLSAVVRGGKAVELQKHIKAVTYHNLEIVETETGVMTTIVFDV
jgi:SHS2 domain-containing protein